MFMKTDFQILKLKFHACSMKQAFCPFHKRNMARSHENTFVQVFAAVPGCHTCMCKRGISLTNIQQDQAKIIQEYVKKA